MRCLLSDSIRLTRSPLAVSGTLSSLSSLCLISGLNVYITGLGGGGPLNASLRYFIVIAIDKYHHLYHDNR
jgi:hypothetical protein